MNIAEQSEEKLYEASRKGHLEEVIQLSALFVGNMDVLNMALRRACKGGYLDVVRWLVEHTKADINIKGVWWTPLTAACAKGHLDVVKYLLNTSHADVNLIH